MFADDTTIVKSGKHTDRELNEDLHRITDWFTASKLTVNIGICEAISFGNGLPEKITTLNEELCYKSSCKYLVSRPAPGRGCEWCFALGRGRGRGYCKYHQNTN